MITEQDLNEYFSHHPPNNHQIIKYQRIRDAAKEFAKVLIQNTNAGEDQIQTIRLLRMVVMSANQTVALEEYEAKKRSNIVSMLRDIKKGE